MQDLCNSLEDAIRQRVESGGFALNTYTGQGDFEKAAPYLVIRAQEGEELPLGSGNWNVRVDCTLEWPAETKDLPGFRQLSSDVFGLLMNSDLASQLTNAENLTVLGVHSRRTETSTDGSLWSSTLTFTCYCFLNDLQES